MTTADIDTQMEEKEDYSDNFEEDPTRRFQGQDVFRSDTPETTLTEVPASPDISIMCEKCKIHLNIRNLQEHRHYHSALLTLKYQGDSKPASLDQLRKRRQVLIRKVRCEKETPTQLKVIQDLNDAYEYLKSELQGTFEEERQNQEEIDTAVNGMSIGSGVPCVCAVGICSSQNDRWKSYMEDARVYQDNFGDDKNKCYVGLFDGYHGRFAADMASAELHHLLLHEMSLFDPRTRSTAAYNMADNVNTSQYSFERPETKDSERVILHEGSVNIVQQIIDMCETKFNDLITPRSARSEKREKNSADNQKENEPTKKKKKSPMAQKMEAALFKSYYLLDILLSYGKDERSRVRWSGCSALTMVIHYFDQEKMLGADWAISPVVEEDEDVKSEVSAEKKMNQSKSSPAADNTKGYETLKDIGMIYLANAGNVHCVLVRGNKAYKLTKDHTPHNEKELNRITKCGADVSKSNKEMRVKGVITTTRGLGNHGDVTLKKSIIVDPYTTTVPIDQYSQFLILATHGVWEVFSEQEASSLLLKLLPSNFIPAPSKVSMTLKPLIEESNSQANISLLTQTPRKVSFSNTEPIDDRTKLSPRASTMLSDRGKLTQDDDTKMELGSNIAPDNEESGNEADVDTYGDYLSTPSNSRLSNYNPSMAHEQFQRDLSQQMAEYLVQAALLAGAKDNITVTVVLLPGCGL